PTTASVSSNESPTGSSTCRTSPPEHSSSPPAWQHHHDRESKGPPTSTRRTQELALSAVLVTGERVQLHQALQVGGRANDRGAREPELLGPGRLDRRLHLLDVGRVRSEQHVA